MTSQSDINQFTTLPQMLEHTLQSKPDKEGYRYYDYDKEQ